MGEEGGLVLTRSLERRRRLRRTDRILHLLLQDLVVLLLLVQQVLLLRLLQGPLVHLHPVQLLQLLALLRGSRAQAGLPKASRVEEPQESSVLSLPSTRRGHSVCVPVWPHCSHGLAETPGRPCTRELSV